MKLHRPVPIRSHTAPSLTTVHSPAPLPPQVYAALYDTLLDRWSHHAVDLEHGNYRNILKRARDESDSSVEGDEDVESASQRVKWDRHDHEADDEPMDEDRKMTRQSSLPSHDNHPAQHVAFSHHHHRAPESNLRDVSPSVRQRAVSNPPPMHHSHPHDSYHLQPTASIEEEHQHARPPLRTARAEALLDVVRSFETVLECRARGWKILATQPVGGVFESNRRRSAGAGY